MGKLVKLLRLLGFDIIFFTGQNDSDMVRIAALEGRIILTRDTHILKRRPVTHGQVRALLIRSDNIEEQIEQVIRDLNLKESIQAFTLCLECNVALIPCSPDEVKDNIPPYVRQTQKEFMTCPHCHRIYWKGTHWAAMSTRLNKYI